MIIIGAATAFMGYHGVKVKTSFRFAELVPQTHDEMIYFKKFKKTFGEDANVFAIGFKDTNLFTLENFNAYKTLCDSINQIEGLNSVLAIPSAQTLVCNHDERRFEFDSIFSFPITTQAQLDSQLTVYNNLSFYKGQLSNANNGATILLISIKKKYVDSKVRAKIVQQITEYTETFTQKTNIKAHYAGLPYVRTIMSGQVQDEIKLFLLLSVLVTAIILYIFFRSFTAVIFPLIIIGMVVLWTTGTIVLLGYEINILTGLIPPIIVVIGVPNCIYLLNKYHQEFIKHGKKIRALSTVIRKIGIATLMTNLTTAVGFFVLLGADITILKEFGLVAGINVIVTFVLSIVLIPAVFAYLPSPSTRHLKHLDFKGVQLFVEWLDYVIRNKRKWVYSITIGLVVVSAYGITRIKAVSFLVDDLPKNHPLMVDLRFFESNFKGVMPLEIVIDLGNKKNVSKSSVMRKVDEFESFLAEQPEVAPPVSLVNFVKAARQAYWNNDPGFYDLPTGQDRAQILSYLKRTKQGTSSIIKTFADNEGHIRISAKVADVGSVRMTDLIEHRIRPKANEIFKSEEESSVKYGPTRITGTTLLFIKGNEFLINNLIQSLFLAILIIAFLMAILFRQFKMIVISLIPNFLPLLFTGAIMGYFGVALKPSTAIIFSIAFGISVDDTIHYLAKFRQELKLVNYNISKAVSNSILETGASMMYTSIVLFFGFIIFVGSSFHATIMLGILTSSTLLMAMVSNLILLPSLLLTFDKKEDEKEMDEEHPLIDDYIENLNEEKEDEFVDLDEDESDENEFQKNSGTKEG